MSITDSIPELEAASLCGVTPVTLNRFAEAGYLCMDEQPDGSRIFSRSELERVFSLSLEPETSDREFDAAETDFDEPSEDDLLTTSGPNTSVDAEREFIVKEVTLKGAEESEAQKPHTNDRETARLTTVVQLQEKYIELKEQELKNLREERDWLRSRIEKLEEKADRDQLILVSVSETNRGLIKALENKRSPLKLAMEWIGLLPSPETPKQ